MASPPTELDVSTLTSERLRLEPLSALHSSGMYDLWRHSEVCAFSGAALDYEGATIVLPARTSSDSDKIADFFIRGAKAGRCFRWAVMMIDENRFIGAVGFNTLGTCSEYAYHFIPRYWGKGFAREASQMALAWLFADKSRKSVECFIEPSNLSSVALAVRLKFATTGEIVEGAQRFLRSPDG